MVMATTAHHKVIYIIAYDDQVLFVFDTEKVGRCCYAEACRVWQDVLSRSSLAQIDRWSFSALEIRLAFQ